MGKPNLDDMVISWRRNVQVARRLSIPDYILAMIVMRNEGKVRLCDRSGWSSNGLPSGPKPRSNSASPAFLAGDPYRSHPSASRGGNMVKRPREPLCGPDAVPSTCSDLTGTIAAARLRRCRLNKQKVSRAKATTTSAPPAPQPATTPMETLDLALSYCSTL